MYFGLKVLRALHGFETLLVYKHTHLIFIAPGASSPRVSPSPPVSVGIGSQNHTPYLVTSNIAKNFIPKSLVQLRFWMLFFVENECWVHISLPLSTFRRIGKRNSSKDYYDWVYVLYTLTR